MRGGGLKEACKRDHVEADIAMEAQVASGKGRKLWLSRSAKSLLSGGNPAGDSGKICRVLRKCRCDSSEYCCCEMRS